MALSGRLGPADALFVKRIEHPWQELSDMAAIIGSSEEKLAEIADAAFDGTDADFERAKSDAGVKGLSKDNTQALLRARTDCRR